MGIGFGLIHHVNRFFHFAHGAVFTSSAYLAFLFHVGLRFPFFASVLLAIAGGTVLGCLIERAVYRRLRRASASPLMLLLASLGVYVVVQNVISIAFGDDTKMIRSGTVTEGVSFADARITVVQLLTVCIGAILVLATGVWFRQTTMGKAMRAVANDPTLAALSGIDSERVFLVSIAAGSALASVAGVLMALDIDMTPTMGMRALMMGAVAALIGGAGRISGVALGAVLLGMAQQLGVWAISAQWQDAIAFVILVLFLVLRPGGILGKKVKRAAV